MKKSEGIISCIMYFENNANFKDVASDKLYNGSLDLYFESPNDTILVTFVSIKFLSHQKLLYF
jgi:hypothetical protein